MLLQIKLCPQTWLNGILVLNEFSNITSKISEKSLHLTFKNIGVKLSTGVGHYFAFYQKLPLKFLTWVGNKNYSMNFCYTWPSKRLIHI